MGMWGEYCVLSPNYFLLVDAQSTTAMLWRKLCPAFLNQPKEVKKEKRDRERKILQEYHKEKNICYGIAEF